MARPKVLLADSLQLECEALEAVLERAGFEIVGHAHNGVEAVRQAADLGPDIAILGPRLPGMNAIEVGRSLSSLCRPVIWILLTSSPDESHVMEALLAGASGYVLRTQPTRELVQALLDALRGHVYVAPGACGFGRLQRRSPVAVS